MLLWWRRRCKRGYGSGRLGLGRRLRGYRARWIRRDGRWSRINGHIACRIISVVALVISITHHLGFRCGGLLSSNFFGGEKAATGSTGATHGMLVAGFMEVWLWVREHGNCGGESSEIRNEWTYANRYLSLLGEAMDLFKACTSDATFEDAKVLLCVHIERFIIDRCLGLGSLRSG